MKRTLCIALCAAMMTVAAFAADTAPAKDGYIWKANADPSKVTIQVKNAKVADVLKMLAEKSGNSPLALPDKWQDKPLTLDMKDLTYFEALDKLCAAAGLSYQSVGFTPALVSAPEARDVGLHLGPATVKVAQITVNRSFRDSYFGRGAGLMLTLDAFWEDRLPVVFNSCEVAKVTASDGRELEMRVRRRGVTAYAIGANPYFGVARAAGQDAAPKPSLSATEIIAAVQNLPEKLGKTVSIEGTLRLAFGSGETALTIPKVLQEGDRSATEGDLSFAVTKVQQMTAAGGTVYGPWDGRAKNPISFVIEVKKNATEPIVMVGGSSPYGVFIVDPNGKRYPCGSLSGSQMLKDDTWVATVYAFFDKPEGMDDTWSLAYVYPEKQESKEWPFTIRDVPLP